MTKNIVYADFFNRIPFCIFKNSFGCLLAKIDLTEIPSLQFPNIGSLKEYTGIDEHTSKTIICMGMTIENRFEIILDFEVESTFYKKKKDGTWERGSTLSLDDAIHRSREFVGKLKTAMMKMQLLGISGWDGNQIPSVNI